MHKSGAEIVDLVFFCVHSLLVLSFVFLIYVVIVDINLPIRLGFVSDDGVARLRCYPGLEHFLPHPGDSHPEAADVTASPHRASLRMGGVELSGEVLKSTTHQGLLHVDGLGQQQEGKGRRGVHCGVIV